MKVGWWLPWVVGLVAIVAAWASVSDPLPAAVSDVAFGSPKVMYVERFLVIFLVALLIVVVLARALRGQLPSEFSDRGLKFEEVKNEAAGATEDLTAALGAMRKRIEKLEKQGK